MRGKYIWPLIEQICAHDEKWVEAWTRLRAQWMAKQEAAREKNIQNVEEIQPACLIRVLLLLQVRPKASANFVLEDIDPAQSAWKAVIYFEIAQTRHAFTSSRAARIGVDID
jgi:hypothetical protein